MTRLFVCPALALSLGVAIAAQSPTEPSFDVVSVKRNTNSDGARTLRNALGNLSAFNVSIRQLIQMAFGVQDFQISALPTGRPLTVTTSKVDSILRDLARRSSSRRSIAQP
jgi:hypothetical protein